MSDAPTVDIGSPSNVLCGRHGEPYRETWPKGYAVAVVRLFPIFVADPEVQRYTGLDAENLTQAIQEFGPMCCRASRDELLEVYRESGIGHNGICVICRKVGLGTPYSITTPVGVQRHEHVCFECVLDRMRQGAPGPPV